MFVGLVRLKGSLLLTRCDYSTECQKVGHIYWLNISWWSYVCKISSSVYFVAGSGCFSVGSCINGKESSLILTLRLEIV